MAPTPPGINDALFRILFDKSADALFVLNMDGTIERANQTACERLQYPLEELVGQPVSRVHGPETRGTVTDILATLRRTGAIRAEIVHQARDGTLIPTEINSHVVEIEGQLRVLTTARDISERKRADEAARANANRYRMLFEHSGTANSIYDRDLRLVLSNEMACRLLEKPLTDLVGRTVEEIFGQELGAEIRCRGERVLATGVPDTNARDVALPGGLRWFQTSYAALTDDAGRVAGLQVTSQDITELHWANEKLRQNEKLESLGVLAGGIAHDFNNLLAGLSGYWELARIHLMEGRTTEALAKIDKSVGVFDRAKALTRQLLTFSKGGTPVRQPHRLGPLLKEWAEFALSGSDVGLELDVVPDLWLCDCDALQIAQVVDNLMINARQVTPPGGTVVLRAANVQRGQPFVQISVSDRGPGIAAEILDKIFDPFFTTKPKGSGLGLSTSRSIVAQHGGSIEVDTQPGLGSTFAFVLPALPGKLARDDAIVAAEIVGSGRVLIMDDEEVVRDTVGETLTTLGFEVTRARNGHDALAFEDKSRREGRPFALVLLDLTIPGGMGGVEAARRLQAQGCPAKVVAMSGYSEQTAQTSLEENGFSGILTKPFSRRDLSSLLSRILG